MDSARTSGAADGASGRYERTHVIADDDGGCGGPRVLVADESRYGSTAEVADRIGQTLGGAGNGAIAPEVDLLDVGGFAGVLDFSRMNSVTRVFARIPLTLRGAEPSIPRRRDLTDARGPLTFLIVAAPSVR